MEGKATLAKYLGTSGTLLSILHTLQSYEMGTEAYREIGS